ncbi:methyltransferase domain-containing protein [Tundrisphaera lichenicola]|uniref:methyltransferase domain-containing protein n=1 Tax=Tundrisphaera lichenicola TaxID=2029860 RepID=UPI003EC0DB53
MAWTWTPERRDEPELMDAPGLPEAEVEDAYRVLRRVNSQLGNLRTMRREFSRFVREDMPGRASFTFLDVGSGSGDIAVALRDLVPDRAGPVLALDRDAQAASAARTRSLAAIRGDALRLPFADRSIDLVTAVKFAHHFTGRPLGRLVEEMARVARHRVIILDIRRDWFAYWGFRVWSSILTRNRLVRHDGPLSVLRGFTKEELIAPVSSMTGWSWTVRPYLGFQLALVGRRVSADSE